MTQMKPGLVRCVSFGMILLGVLACDDTEQIQPTEPSIRRASTPEVVEGGALPFFPEMAEHIPPVRLGTSEGSFWSSMSDAELVDVIRRAGGRVMIGLKPADAARTEVTGVVPGVDRNTAYEARRTVEALGARITRTFRYTSAVAAYVPAERVPDLRRLEVVDYLIPSLPAYPAQATPPQDTSWGVRRIGAHHVWQGLGAQSTRGQVVSVVMLDTGIDETHAWSMAGDGPANWIPDCYWADSASTSCFDDLTNPMMRGHGPHIAGTIAGRDNDFGFIGVANDPGRFVSIKVCNNDGCPPENVVAALEWVIDSVPVRPIINMSFGWCTHNQFVQQAIALPDAAGALMIASAGNELSGAPKSWVCKDGESDLPDWKTSVLYPARYSQVMAVSGVLSNEQFAVAPPPDEGGGTNPWDLPDCDEDCPQQSSSCNAGSRYGPEIEIAAPFSDSSMVQGGQYDLKCGTSMSAAFVTGAAALVWSRNPSWTAQQVRQRLKSTAYSTAVPLPSVKVGSGRVNVFDAVYIPPPIYSASISGATDIRPHAKCSFHAVSTSPHTPHTFSWSVDGTPVGYYGDFIQHTAGATSFKLEVAIQDANGQWTYAMHDVGVDYGAPECLDS